MIDASALIAFLLNETGAEVVEARLNGASCALSTVQRTEVVGKLVGSGAFSAEQIEARLRLLTHALDIVPFDLAQSGVAAHWYARRSAYKLSLGDCACLALAETRAVGVLTAERRWAELPGLRVPVEIIR